MLDSFKPTNEDRDLILGAMRRWLAGESVWPYADILVRWGGEFEMDRRQWMRRHHESPGEFHARWEREFELTTKLHVLRCEWIKEFGFAIPCRELIDVLAEMQPVVEIGAGSGYLTALARTAGINIVGTDVGGSRYEFEAGRYDPGQLRLEGKTAVRRFRDRTVFCAWPSLGQTWFRQALNAMRIGGRLIVIREEACAENTAWDYLDACFECEANIAIPAWPHMNDFAGIYRKRRQKARA